jgi:hypothetical protein
MLKRGVDCRSKLKCKKAPIWGATIEAHIISKMQPSYKLWHLEQMMKMDQESTRSCKRNIYLYKFRN